MDNIKRCAECGIPLRRKRDKYCSYGCANKAKAGRKTRKKAKDKEWRELKGIDKQVSDAILDDLWRDVIRLKHGNRCAVSNKLPKCDEGGIKRHHDAHHIEGRWKSIRWRVDNGILLSVWHHVRSQELSAHNTIITFKAWLVDSGYMTQAELDELKRLKRSPNTKTNNEWYAYLLDQKKKYEK